ncbi:hypothetical protein F2Q68_00018288 [Brassica cretica]|uniref:Cation/H+ exchanger transmembrane domain-containing protein n=1 Tax=Brassica cretica TaxID=69181 RepID=A0A8S9HR44_BRACR|nr:hypothetical protein F2Q68_00018288 [Brassica cretica]
MLLASLFTSLTSKMLSVSTSDHASVVSLNLFVALLCACIVIGHLLEEHRWINESITALLIGLGTGVVILLISRGKNSHLLVFSEDLFFIYLLPPIIFNAGFQVKKKQFFRNFVTIMAFGAIGTIISCTVISLGAIHFFKKLDIATFDLGDILAIGAIFAATDSVCTLQVLNQDETPLLYSLVFGEGVVNDATSVVLFNAIQSFDLTHLNHKAAFHFLGNFLYLFLLSTILGVATGLISAYVIKKLYFGRHSTDREVALMMLMAYLSYMLAEVFGMLTKPLIRHLMPHQSTTTSMLSDDNTPKSIHMPLLDGEQQEQDSFVEFSGSHHDVPRPDSLRGFLMRPARTVHHYWRQFDDAFMRPVFGGRGFVPFIPGSPIERSTHDLSKP